MTNAKLKPMLRSFFPTNFKVDSIENLKPYLEKLQNFSIETKEHFELFLMNLSETEAIISEDACWRQIQTTCDTQNEKLQLQLNYFYSEIQPVLQVFSDQINKKIIESPFSKNLSKDYFVFIKNIKKNIELFDEKNVPILSTLALLQNDYASITGKMTVQIDGQEMTLQKATLFLKESDRHKREKVYFQIQERRLADSQSLNLLFSDLIQKRHQVAQNSGFQSFTEYKFKELGRFDYTPEDCFSFHQGIKKHIMPLVNQLYQQKKKDLEVDTLKPWDLDAPAKNEQSLKPFETTEELIQKSIQVLEKIDPFFANCLKEMVQLKRLDLESRKGKAPGGYNCPLAETGVPFIFMNAVGTLDDLITMIHESGHAVHSFLSHDLPLSAFKEYPMEIAELASMSMELFSLNEWDVFFENKKDLKRAKLQQWERVMSIFPWIAIIDSFQHWIYANPQHTVEQRLQKWTDIHSEFTSPEIDFTEVKKFIPYTWQKQLHLFEVPFYYIEYGIAQLGAIAMYKNYKNNQEECLKQYKNALSQGGKMTLKELYEKAGISLRFDAHYIQEMMVFVEEELNSLKNL